MIKLIMVHLDGTESDAVRLTAVEELVALFGAHVVALLLNPIPKIVPSDAGAGVQLWTQLTDMAHEAGDRIEAILAHRLAKLSTTSEIRRFDVFAEEAANVAAREARTADLFVALRLGGADVSPMTDDIVEGVLFGSGRHLLLVSKAEHFAEGFEHCLLAWDGGQEAARAMAEALPYLRESRTVSVVVVVDREAELQPEELSGIAAVNYLTQHGILARINKLTAVMA